MTMEEFENHPLFMDPNHLYTQDEIDDNEFLQQMQAMKYSDGDTLDEQAEAYKSDGTFHFKCKLYKKACVAYSKERLHQNKRRFLKNICDGRESG